MDFCPYLDKFQLLSRQIPLQQLSGLDFNYGAVFVVDSMEMRRNVVVLVHLDNDSKKSAYFWHCMMGLA